MAHEPSRFFEVYQNKALGNSMNCYCSTCYGDEVFSPKLCEQVNFEFKRQGTLATGKPCCDMTFIRK